MLGILVLISISANAGEAKYNNKISDEIKGISSQNIYDINNNYANAYYDSYDDDDDDDYYYYDEEEDNDNDYYDEDDNDDDGDYYYYYEYDEED
jgi:RNA polymerase II subunit 5-mediating protein homolog